MQNETAINKAKEFVSDQLNDMKKGYLKDYKQDIEDAYKSHVQ